MGTYADPQLQETFEQTARLQEDLFSLFTLEKGNIEVRVPQFFSHSLKFHMVDRKGKPSLVRFLGHVLCTPHLGFQIEV